MSPALAREAEGRETPPAAPTAGDGNGAPPEGADTGEESTVASGRPTGPGTPPAAPAPRTWPAGAAGAGGGRPGVAAGIVDQDGEVLAGSGFTTARRMTGVYTVAFPPGAWRVGGLPVPVVTAYIQSATVAVGHVSLDARGGTSFSVLCSDPGGHPLDCAFSFIVALP